LAIVATGTTPKRTNSGYWENGVIPWLTSTATGNDFIYEAEQFVTDLAVKECRLKVFEAGTLLLAMYGEGKTRGQVTEIKISATCNQACAAIIVDSTLISRDFLKIRLLENYEETRKAAVGGAQPNLNLSKVRDIPVLLPKLVEQTEIVRRVEQLFVYTDKIEQQVQAVQHRVDKLTQSILAKAFRGELTAQWRKDNPELISGDNSAEALLAKIKAEREALLAKNKTKKKAPSKSPNKANRTKKPVKVTNQAKVR
jgi:type I restriction enzyme S subunit